MLDDFSGRSQPVYWLQPLPEVARTLRAIVGPSFREIDSAEQLVRPEVEVLVEVTTHTQVERTVVATRL
jgi:hypothetical protein